jgi:hypothetical protein
MCSKHFNGGVKPLNKVVTLDVAQEVIGLAPLIASDSVRRVAPRPSRYTCSLS